VAEGVETEEQHRFLRRHEYDELQGFLFSQPERAVEVESRIHGLAAAQQRQATGDIWTLPEVAVETSLDPAPERPVTFTRPPSIAAPAAEESEIQPGAAVSGESTSQLLRLARRDFLTGLYNRFSFDERLEHAAAHADRYGHKLALLMIDLDDFKYVNDTHGHPIGDALLVRVAQRLEKLVRKVDTLARIGGDEFAVIYSEFQEVDSVTEFARRFLSVLSEPVEIEGRELRVNASLGVSVYPEGDARPQDLLRQADLALYKAKNLGSGRIHFFAPEMDRDVQRSLALTRDLCGALDRAEFEVAYQPLVELKSGSIHGVEALLRWRHPSLGAVDPESFIPLAESSGEIRSVGEWVIRSACAQVSRWRQSSGQEVSVSVNISPVQCRDAGFARTVLRALEEHGLPPTMLNLELSERLLMSLPEEMEEPLRKLEALGVGLTFDNFGKGSSALEHFNRFRFRRLKIDRSLVWNIGKSSESGDVLGGIVALAHKINVQIVAGGIERSEEATRLLAEGCELGQGFLFSRPVTGDHLLDLLRGGGRPLGGFKLIQGGSAAGGHGEPSGSAAR